MFRIFHGALWVFIGMCSVTGGTAQAYAQLCCPTNKSHKSSLEGAALPALTLADLQGKEVALADLKGKVVVLSFWKGGLLNKEGQIPTLTALQARYGTEKLRVVGVAMNDRAEAAARQWMKEQGLDCEVLRGDEKVTEQCSLTSLPVTLIIDQQGIVSKQYEGLVEVSQVVEQVKVLLRG